ncbi:copper resistance D family protein [Methylosinus sp. Sm6]|uniref:copper resistance D family protein n=1 Tax=Methylosinus sp. Sm6 TaxID=2866948 RepID=UPI001C9945D2|nr:CopD family protein [Methylosinus sp. Sm6]MBY6241440.1 CopD family protein [Methylosinus sp. Sm6]
MQQFIEIYGFLSVLLRGAISAAQSLGAGGVGFLLLIAPALGPQGAAIAASVRNIVFWSALALIGLVALDAASLSLMLIATLELDPLSALTADAVKADALALGPALVLAVASRARGGGAVLVAAALALLGARLGTTHAVSRVDSPPWLALAEFAHLVGAALWIGGVPYFLLALARAPDGEARAIVGRRFSGVSMAGAALVLCGGVAMSGVYIDSLEALYGLAYGVMVGAKGALLAGLLTLGAFNFFAVRRLREGRARPLLRLRRFAEAEIGLGLTAILAAASLSSLPPAVDQPQGRVSLAEIVERLTPQWPIRLESPDHSSLSVARPAPAAAATDPQAEIPAVVAAAAAAAPRNAEDIAWSEYNHHIAGLFVLAMGVLALVEHWPRAAPAARHWPLLMLGLAGFLFLRADEAVWPLGELGLIESLRDPEIAQHRIFLALVVAFGLFEWRVRTKKVAAPWAPLAFPLITGLGGALLLAHSHGLADVKQEFLIEITHTPLALVGVASAAARWLEIRLPDRAGRIAGLLWPVGFMLAGLMLLVYREA